MYLHIYRIKHIATTLKTDLYQLIRSVLDPVTKMNFQFVLLAVLPKKKRIIDDICDQFFFSFSNHLIFGQAIAKSKLIQKFHGFYNN